MKILIVTQYFYPEQFKINDLCVALVKRGHDVTVYTGIPNYPEGKFYKGYGLFGPFQENYHGVKIIRTPLFPRGSKKGVFLVLNYLSFFIISTILAPFLVREKFDSIFAYQLSPIFSVIPAIFIKWIKNIPLTIWVTDLWPESLEATGSVKNKKIINSVGTVVKWIYKCCDRILITSKGFENKVLAMGATKEKIFYWPQWAEETNQDILESYSDNNFPQNAFTILFAGNIGSAQDFPSIIASAIITKENKNIKYVILGDGLVKSWAETEVAKNKLEETVIFLGRKPVETMPYYFKKSSVLLVSLTNAEIFSLTVPSKVQSYLASGKPILGSLNGEGADLILRWDAGMVAPASSPEILAKKIVEFSNLSPERLNEMGTNAMNAYLKEFEREKLFHEFEEHIKSINAEYFHA